MEDERLEQMERRIIALETLVRGLLSSGGNAPVGLPPRASARVPLRERLAATAKSVPESSSPVPSASRSFALDAAAPRQTQSAEQWLGLQGVLAVGVLLIVMSAVFSLVWAIDHGYISPLVRCLVGAVVGFAVAGIGRRQYHRGIPKYGAALIGAGCAILYLVLWAAGQLYGLIPATFGLNLIRLVCLGLAAVAYRYEEEALGVIAAGGAFIAPVLIPGVSPSPFFTMVYLGIVTLSLGAVALKQRWRSMLNVVSLGFLLSAAVPTDPTAPWLLLASAVFYGLSGFVVWRILPFAEVRLASFLGSWLLLFTAKDGIHPYGLVLTGAVLLAATAWYEGLGTVRVWLDRRAEAESASWGQMETVAFYLTPLFLLAIATGTPSEWLVGRLWFLAALLAVPYLAAGYQRVRSHFALVGIGMTLAALHFLLEDTSLVFPVLEVAVIASWLDPKLGRRDGRWFALIATGLGLSALLNALEVRPVGGLAFRDSWALALYVAIMVTGLLAHRLWRVYPEEQGLEKLLHHNPDIATPTGLRRLAAQFSNPVIGLLWILSGSLTFVGVTVEIVRLMGQLGLAPETATLATGLAVSAWWACFAGGLIGIGFRRSITAARLAGLGVAAVAVAKVLLFDLAELNAFYRVGSFLILGVVLLGVAYLYHRQAREEVVEE